MAIIKNIDKMTEKDFDRTYNGLCHKIHPQILKHKLNYFNCIVDYDEETKTKIPTNPFGWTFSTFDEPKYLDTKFNNFVCLLMGQQLFGKRLVLLDIDNKETTKQGIFYHNGFDGWNLLKEKHNYETKTVRAKTGSGGRHYFFLVDEPNFEKLRKSYTGIFYEDKYYSIDFKINNQCAYIQPSFYIRDNIKYEYKFINSDFNTIETLPQFLFDLLLSQTKETKPLSQRLSTNPNYVNKSNITSATEEELQIIKKILDKLSVETKTKFEKWFSVGKALFNLGVDYKIYDEWSKGVNSYKLSECQKRYKHFERMEICQGIHTLLFFLKESVDAEIYNELYKEVYNVQKWKNTKNKYRDNLWSTEKIFFDGNNYFDKAININSKFLMDKNIQIKYCENPTSDKEIFMNKLYEFLNTKKIKILSLLSCYGSGL